MVWVIRDESYNQNPVDEHVSLAYALSIITDDNAYDKAVAGTGAAKSCLAQ